MKLDLNEIAAQSGRHLDYQIDEPPVADMGDAVCADRVTGVVTLANTGRNLAVRGELKTTLQLECGRCLKIFRIPLRVQVEEHFALTPAAEELEEEDEYEAVEDETDVLFVDNILDLTELIRQYVLVNVPVRRVCSEECKGLCPRCGRDLGDGSCSCVSDAESSPFGVLASLLEQENGKVTENGDE